MHETTRANGLTERCDWAKVDWARARRVVKNLRQRIFRAASEGNLKKVRSLQKLMLRCYSNALLSVKRVTQQNKGKNTPGVDRVVVKTDRARGKMVETICRHQPWRVRPVRRVYIPKGKSWDWLRAHYWSLKHPTRQDHWVFGVPETGRYLEKFRWVRIQRHTLVKGTASPDDPALQDYWAKRRARARRSCVAPFPGAVLVRKHRSG